MKKLSKATFSKSDLLKVIDKHSNLNVYYVSGYDNMREYIFNNDEHLHKISTHIRKHNYNVIFISFNPKLKRYYIETIFPNEYIYIYNDDKQNLNTIKRFFKKTTSLDDVDECGVCCEKIRNDLSEPIFNALTYTCERCFNTICISCYSKMQNNNKYICCFCKKSTDIGKIVEIVSSSKKVIYIDRNRYNEVMKEVDYMCKSNVYEDVLRNHLTRKLIC